MPKRRKCIWLTTTYKKKLRHINVVCLLHINYSYAITHYPGTVKCDLSQRAGEMTCVFCRWVRFRIMTYIGIILKHVYLNEECKQLYNTLGFCQRGTRHELELVTEVLIFNHVNLSYKGKHFPNVCLYEDMLWAKVSILPMRRWLESSDVFGLYATTAWAQTILALQI